MTAEASHIVATSASSHLSTPSDTHGPPFQPPRPASGRVLHEAQTYADLDDRFLSSPSSEDPTPDEDEGGELQHERDWRQYKNVTKRLQRERKRKAQEAFGRLEKQMIGNAHDRDVENGWTDRTTGESSQQAENGGGPLWADERVVEARRAVPSRRPSGGSSTSAGWPATNGFHTVHSSSISDVSDSTTNFFHRNRRPRTRRSLPKAPTTSPSDAMRAAAIAQSNIMAHIMASPDPDIQVTGTIPATLDGLITLDQLMRSGTCEVVVKLPGDANGLELSKAMRVPRYLRSLIKYFEVQYLGRLKPGTRVDFVSDTTAEEFATHGVDQGNLNQGRASRGEVPGRHGDIVTLLTDSDTNSHERTSRALPNRRPARTSTTQTHRRAKKSRRRRRWTTTATGRGRRGAQSRLRSKSPTPPPMRGPSARIQDGSPGASPMWQSVAATPPATPPSPPPAAPADPLAALDDDGSDRLDADTQHAATLSKLANLVVMFEQGDDEDVDEDAQV